jgi:hypothetical protein
VSRIPLAAGVLALKRKGIAVQAQQVARQVLESLKQIAVDATCGLRARRGKWKPPRFRGAIFKPDGGAA